MRYNEERKCTEPSQIAWAVAGSEGTQPEADGWPPISARARALMQPSGRVTTERATTLNYEVLPNGLVRRNVRALRRLVQR